MQIKADVNGLSLLTMGGEEAASLRTIILGVVACGLESNCLVLYQALEPLWQE